MKLQIKDALVQTMQLNGKNGAYERRSQVGWVELVNGELRKVRVPLAKDQVPYALGLYQVSDESFGVNEWGDLQIAALKLQPLQVAKAA